MNMLFEELIPNMICASPSKRNVIENAHENHKGYLLKKPSSCWNPFGPVVGSLNHVFSCGYQNQRGQMYVASRALCFRRTALLGWEICRVVIPWEHVLSIDESDHGAISIQTQNEEKHEIHGFHDDVGMVKVVLSDAWNKRHMESEQDVKNKRTVHQFYKRVSLMSTLSDDSEVDEIDQGSLNVSHQHHHPDSLMEPEKLQSLWSSICSEDDSKYSEHVTVNLKLDITLDDFFDTFLSDNAQHSIASHHEASGDQNVTCTPWEPCHNSYTLKRFITYSHPIHTHTPLSIAPPAGTATKTQILRKFQTHGLCIDTETWIRDVPLADCFYVADRLCVSSDPTGGIFLTVKFGNCFVKPTFFKGIITSTSTRDVSKFHREYIEQIKKCVERDSKESKEPSIQPSVLSLQKKESSSVMTGIHVSKLQCYMILFMLVAMCGNQIFLWKELQTMNETMSMLEILFNSQYNIRIKE